MPVHDWTRVIDGVFHDFHGRWITYLTDALNQGVLPADYYALSEQRITRAVPDVLTLRANGASPPAAPPANGPTACTLTATPPNVRFCLDPEPAKPVRYKRIAVRHASDDATVAVLEIVSPGNKYTDYAMDSFVKKSRRLMRDGIHLLVVDLLPPGPCDPRGVHALIWEAFDRHRPYVPPQGKPLILAAYRGDPGLRAYVEPVGVGDELTAMPLFLDQETYVNVPLEATYRQTYSGVPRRYREELER